MCEVENNIKLSWLLVSQFVSWDFCRYMCEQNDTWEPDVLTFLRNMVVERTEKAASDITKHEMVARFVMEARTIRTVARMPFIRELSKKVEEKCPELKSTMAELLFDLEGFLISLERSKDSQEQEEILRNMAQEVNKFNVEACKSLPLPNLLQVIQTWLQAEYQAHLLKADIKKNIENEELFQKVVDCLHEEKVTSEEAKAIALALYEDKSLKKIFLLNNSETETDIDSQSQSRSLQPYQALPKQLTPPQSLHISSRYKLPSPVQKIEPDNTTRSFTFNPVLSSPDRRELPDLSLHDSFDPSSPEEPLEGVQQYKVSDDIQDFGVLNPNKSYFFKPSTGPQVATRSSHANPLVEESDPISLGSSDSNSSEITSATSASRNKRRWKRLLEEFRLDDDFSESDSRAASKRAETPEVVEDIPVQNHFGNCDDDDDDTSDCDKDADLKFLTPTMFKSDYVEKNPAPVMVSSDNESFNSSVTTAPANSQKYDPTFKTSCKVVPAKDSPILPAKKRLKTSSKNSAKKTPMNYVLARISEDSEAPRQATLRRFGFASNAADAKNTAKQATEPKKKTYKLFDNDIPVTRSSDESSLFQIETRNKKKNLQPKTVNLGNKRRCEECKKTFKTPTELKRHVFIVHTVEDLSDD
ncbi:hypothetical protein AVEN_137899-1 [Araneus ventricosus]|uniref:C2H2-type domain-containing protein n=1 Tax=Araneus ventricosus TaxID=182803 RepID=A0A4Y2LBR0_ARAVE|nr:hypothetical protein AVEN_137899-1 [Araneus ventricosus]